MSSILAFTMLISSLVMVNVVNVSAADTNITWDFSSAVGWNCGGTVQTETSYTAPTSGTKQATCFKEESGYTLTYYAYNKDKIGDTLGLKTNGSGAVGAKNWSKNQRYFEITNVPAGATIIVDVKTKPGSSSVMTYQWDGDDAESTTKDSADGTDYKKISVENNKSEAKGLKFGFGGATVYIRTVTLSIPDPNSKVYKINGTCSGLTAGQTFTLTDSAKPEAPYTATVNDDNTSYTVSQRASDPPFSSSTKLTASLDGYLINGAATADVTLAGENETFNATPELNFVNNQYSVTLKVVDASSSEAIDSVVAYKDSDNKTPIKIENSQTGVEIKLNKGINETFHIGAPGYLGTSTEEITDGKDKQTITVRLKKIPESGSINNGNSISTKLFYDPQPEKGCSGAYNFDLSNYKANGYTISAAQVQMFDSKEAKAGNGRFKMKANATIEYTPTEPGILTIRAAASGDGERGYSITPSPETADGTDENPVTLTKSMADKKHALKENQKYIITVKNNDINIESVSFESNATKYPVTITADNQSGEDVTVNVDSESFTASSGTNKEHTINLTEGEHELSAQGYTITPSVINVQSAGDNKFSVTIEKATLVNVKFSLANDTGVPEVTAKNPDKAITIIKLNSKNDDVETKTLSDMSRPVTFENVDAGTKFKFYSQARNVIRWLSVREGTADTNKAEEGYNYEHKSDIGFFNGKDGDNRYFIYTVPDKNTVKQGQEYGVQFTAVASVESLNIQNNKNSNGNNIKEISFGQYGFGTDKAELCGNDARENMNYIFEYAGLGDYGKGYAADIYNDILPEFDGVDASVKTTNEYGILNAEGTGRHTHAVFKTAVDVKTIDGKPAQAIIDSTGDIKLFELKSDSLSEPIPGNQTEIKSTASVDKNKVAFPIEANKIYGIRASQTGADVECYLKSVRILNPNNVFDNTVGENETNVTKLDESAISALNDAGITDIKADPGETVFRIVGKISLSEDDGSSIAAATSYLNTIDSVGFDAYTFEDYKKYDVKDNLTAGYHFTDVNSLDEGVRDEYTEPANEITFSDVVNTAVDYDNDPNNGVALGKINPSGTFSEVYVQTFYAATEDMVLIPWVKYKTDSSKKVYSLISIADASHNGNISETNNVFLDVNP